MNSKIAQPIIGTVLAVLTRTGRLLQNNFFISRPS